MAAEAGLRVAGEVKQRREAEGRQTARMAAGFSYGDGEAKRGKIMELIEGITAMNDAGKHKCVVRHPKLS